MISVVDGVVDGVDVAVVKLSMHAVPFHVHVRNGTAFANVLQCSSST